MTGIFNGTISLSDDTPVVENGTMELTHNQEFSVVYQDSDNGYTGSGTITDSAVVDYLAPAVVDVQVESPW